MKRHEMIGFLPDWGDPVEQVMVRRAQKFLGVANYTSATTGFRREQDVYRALEMVAARHLEIPGIEDASPWINKGFDCSLHLFLDDWKSDRDPEGYNLVAARRRRDSHVAWYAGFSRGLILGLLSERWGDVARLCSWPWVGLVPEYSGMGSDLEDEVALMYIVVAASLRDAPMEGLERLKAKIRKGRTKRPRLLMKLWGAVEGGTQCEFQEAMRQSLAHHASGKRLDDRDAMLAERLALAQTAICLVAMRKGLQSPDLPDSLSVYLVTRQSLGLNS